MYGEVSGSRGHSRILAAVAGEYAAGLIRFLRGTSFAVRQMGRKTGKSAEIMAGTPFEDHFCATDVSLGKD